METVPDFEEYEDGSEQKVRKVPRNGCTKRLLPILALLMIVSALKVVTTKNIVHAALWLVHSRWSSWPVFIVGAEFVA